MERNEIRKYYDSIKLSDINEVSLEELERQIAELEAEAKTYTGWDDPRLIESLL